MVLCPSTPTKKRPSTVVASPYFSPTKKEHTNRDVAVNIISKDAETEEEEESDDDSVRFHDDPLFSYLCRTFLGLYRRLQDLKPKLVQESVSDDPWKVLVAVTLLNKTTGKVALPVFWHLMEKWNSPWAMSQVDEGVLGELLKPLGTYNMRSRRLIDLSEAYIREPPNLSDLRASKSTMPLPPGSSSLGQPKRYPPTPISHLPGTGPYALDSYRIFCTAHGGPEDEWKKVMPGDKELIRYLKWRWASKERKIWMPIIGVTGPVTVVNLKDLISELESAR